MNFQSLLSSDTMLELIQKKCQGNFSDQNDQDECYLFILNELEAGNYSRLSKSYSESQSVAYISTVVNNLVVDFRRKKYGRRRFPALIKRLGEFAEAVYRYVCWQKFTYADAYDFVLIDNLYTGSWNDFLLDIEEIRTAPCAQNPQFVSPHTNGNDMFENIPTEELNPLDMLVEKLDQGKKSVAIEVVRDTLNAMSEADRLLIRLIYGDDHKKSQAAKVLGISPQKAGRRLKTLLLNIKENLFKKGVRSSYSVRL